MISGDRISGISGDSIPISGIDGGAVLGDSGTVSGISGSSGFFGNTGNLVSTAVTFSVTAAELARLGLDRYAYLPDDIVWSETGRYDENNHRTESTDIYGNTTYYEYDASGNVTKTTDHNGNVTTNEYDTRGRLVKTTDPNGNVTEYVHSDFGMKSVTLYGADGSVTVLSQTDYDNQGRVWRTIDQTGRVTEYRYTLSGQQQSGDIRDSIPISTTVTFSGYSRDLFGRLTAVILPQVKHPETGEMVHVRYEYAYDAMGNQISLKDNIFQTDPADASTIDRSAARETRFTYDWQGRQTSRTLPDGLTEYFFYNVEGQTTHQISFEGRVTVYEYDALGRLAKKLFFTSKTAWNNGAGISGHTISYTYDSLGRVIREVDSKVGTTETTYNADCQVSRISSPTGIINYEYDAITGQVTRTWTGTDSNSPITDVRNTYDKLGRLETVETYAREGALLTNPEIARYVYDVIGNLDKIHHSNGIVTDYNYDLLNRLQEVKHTDTQGTESTVDDVVVEEFEYTYHANGNKSGEVAVDKDGNLNTWNWDYDALGRLIKERHDNHDNSLDYTTDYVFDLVGNRLEKRTDTNGDAVADEVIVSLYDQNDRLLNESKLLNGAAAQETTYDYSGTEQTGKTVYDLLNSRIESKTRMEYNDQGRMSKIVIETYVNGSLSKVVTQEYTYDSSGIKIKQTETTDENADGTADSTKSTEYLNDGQNHTGYSQVLEERTSENGGAEKVTTYTIGHDVLAQYDAVNGLLALLTDGHGSTRAIANSLGEILQQFNYDAYGNAHGFDASAALTNLLYSGEQFNPVSGLQYLRARWYNPQSGTFNRLDPFAGDRNSPLSFHKYAYGNMNPVENVDPSGNFSIIWALGILGGLIGGYYAYENALANNYKGTTFGLYVIGGVLAGAGLGAVGGFMFGAAARVATIAMSAGKAGTASSAMIAAAASNTGYAIAGTSTALGAANGFLAFAKNNPNADYSSPTVQSKLLWYLYAGAIVNLGGTTLQGGIASIIRSSGKLTSLLSGVFAGGVTSMTANNLLHLDNSGLSTFGGALIGGLSNLALAGLAPISSSMFSHYLSDFSVFSKAFSAEKSKLSGEEKIYLTQKQIRDLQLWETRFGR